MRSINELLIASINIYSLDFTIVVTNADLSIEYINGWCEMILLQSDLSQELVFTLVAREHGNHIVFSSRNEYSLGTSNWGDFTSMCLENETKILLLIPNMDTTICTTRVADTILVKWSAIELRLSVFLSKSTILEQFFTSIGWVPELNRSCRHSNKFQVIWFLGPLDIMDGVSTSWESKKHLFPLNVVDIHVVIIALINSSNISLTWTNRKSSYTLRWWAKWELSNWLHCQSIPDMTCRKFTAFTCGNNISQLTTSNV